MKKKLVIGVLSAVLLAGGATVVLGADALDSGKLAEIKSLTQQMFGLQQQIVDKEVEAGLLTQEQADKIKEGLTKKQERSDEALVNGKAPIPGMGKDHMIMNFKAGEPLTEEQIAAWLEKAKAALEEKKQAMKNAGKTDAEIAEWATEAQARLDEQAEAMKNGTFAPGKMGFGMGKGMHGREGMTGKDGFRSGREASGTTPEAGATTNS
jgi:hypothetical protein